jgi:hypothetical protein
MHGRAKVRVSDTYKEFVESKKEDNPTEKGQKSMKTFLLDSSRKVIYEKMVNFSQVPVAQPVILATQEAEIRRIMVRGQSGQIVREILSRKTLHKKRADGVAQGVGPEFKPQYAKTNGEDGQFH